MFGSFSLVFFNLALSVMSDHFDQLINLNAIVTNHRIEANVLKRSEPKPFGDNQPCMLTCSAYKDTQAHIATQWTFFEKTYFHNHAILAFIFTI